MPIGNYWMDHPYHSVAEGILFKKNFHRYLDNNNLNSYIDTNCSYAFFFSPNKTTIDNLELLNTSINIGITKINNKNNVSNFLKQIKCLAPSMFKKYLFDKDFENNYNFNIDLLSDQEPSFNNKIVLGNNTDPNNIPSPMLYWKRSKRVRESSKKIVESIASFLIEKNLGRLAADEFLYNNTKYTHLNGYHHMGGTRMGENSNSSVVDKNLKVHDTKNLFVNGSSVFVTAGHAYPTLTITQLSLKLADHIDRIMT